MYAQKGYSRAIAFKRATVSSLGGFGKALSIMMIFPAVRVFSRLRVEVLFVAVANVKVFFFMRQNLQVVKKVI
jgi:hypothetical protein